MKVLFLDFDGVICTHKSINEATSFIESVGDDYKNHELEISGKKRLPGKGSLHYLATKDVNNDSVKEICFTGDSLLYIFSSEFKKLVKINISTHGELNFTVKQLKDDADKIVYQANGNLYLISIFEKNQSLVNSSIAYFYYIPICICI